MSYRQKSEVLGSIKRREHTVKGKVYVGYEAYFGTDPFTKKPLRIMRDCIDEVKREIKSFYLRMQSGGDSAARLTALQALDAKNALDALAAAGVRISLAEVVEAYLGGVVRTTGEDDCGKTLGEMYDEFLKLKKDGADKRKTIATTEKWVVHQGRDSKVSLVSAKAVVDYLQKNYGEKKPKTYNSHLMYIKTFLNWCRSDERKYLKENPLRNVKMKEEPWEEPEYMKPAEVERLFRVLEGLKDKEPELLAYAVVNFFCGSRAIEIQRMAFIDDAAKIHLDDETIRIAKGKGFQRGRRPRAFHIEPTAMAWMRSFDFLTALKGITKDTNNRIYEVARKNKIPVFQNCGRHTFITYHVAAFGDPAKTQAIVGTSAKMRAENYCGLASKAEGEAFFKIMPENYDVTQEFASAE